MGDTPIKVIVSQLPGTLAGNAMPDSLYIYNFFVLRPNEGVVRSRLPEVMAALPSAPQTLRPNDMLDYEWTWDQRGQGGESVGSDTYQVVGTLRGPPVGSGPTSVTIR